VTANLARASDQFATAAERIDTLFSEARDVARIISGIGNNGAKNRVTSQAWAQRRGFDVIEHRQLGGDRCIRAREW
jgi:hypothetical protein